MPSSAYDVKIDTSISIEELIERHVKAAQAVAQATQASANVQQDMAAKLKDAIAKGDSNAATDARNAMFASLTDDFVLRWEALFTMFKSVYDLADVWNELAPRVTEDR